jgi:hypothetical protein
MAYVGEGWTETETAEAAAAAWREGTWCAVLVLPWLVVVRHQGAATRRRTKRKGIPPPPTPPRLLLTNRDDDDDAGRHGPCSPCTGSAALHTDY